MTVNTSYKTVCDVLDTEANISVENGTLHVFEGQLKLHYNGSFIPVSGGISTEQIVFVSKKSDFPTAVDSVITLEDDITYFITSNVDLTGDRLVSGVNTTILGASSENCSLTSTGLDVTKPLLYSDYTLPIRHITFKNVTTAIEININNTGAQPIALDWTGVNFSGCVINLACGDIDNFIFSKGAVLGSGKFIFQGDAGTIGIDNSLFTGNGQDYAIIELPDTANITRRFRIIYSSFVAFGSTKAISISTSATLPIEGYILDTVNFSGDGTYLDGIGQLFTDNEPLWVNNKGILNTSNIANYYMSDNATVTNIASSNTPVKIVGTTTSNAITQKSTHTDNRATYVGAIQRDFKVTSVLSVTSTSSNDQIGFYIAKNGVVIDESELYVTTNNNNRAESICIQTITSLNQNDYIEIWAENRTDSSNITVTFMNVVIESLN